VRTPFFLALTVLNINQFSKKISPLETALNFQQIVYNIFYHILNMLLHYPVKFDIRTFFMITNFVSYAWQKMKLFKSLWKYFRNSLFAYSYLHICSQFEFLRISMSDHRILRIEARLLQNAHVWTKHYKHAFIGIQALSKLNWVDSATTKRN